MLTNSIQKIKSTIRSKYLGEDVIDLGSQSVIIPFNFRYKLIKVSAMHVGRPDLVSEAVYGQDDYGDLLCKINNIPNPFELNEGDILVCPVLTDIPNFFVTDDFNELEESTYKPTLKSKRDKRKANDAVIGDSRFKVDQANRIIVY